MNSEDPKKEGISKLSDDGANKEGVAASEYENTVRIPTLTLEDDAMKLVEDVAGTDPRNSD